VPERALEIARRAVGAGPTTPGRAFRVCRIDRPGTDYHLVLFDDAIAAVSVETESALEWARVADPKLPVDEQAARDLAGLGSTAVARLAWRSCTATRSPLYPLWEVRQRDQVKFVDQQRRVWSILDPGGRGG
jgi:hypothetical protein